MGANADMSSYNLFVYCGNNPVSRYDSEGMFWNELWSGVKTVISSALHIGNTILVSFGVDTAICGEIFLQMTKDKNGIYHASFDCWQQYLGYNSFYDLMFDIGSSMKPAKFEFVSNGISYILWAWKGDYLNLGAGAELGIYYYGTMGHWLVDKKLAMSMTMTVKYNGKTIISYSAATWWITGFNPNYINVRAGNLTVTYVILFRNKQLFTDLYNRHKKTPGWTFLTNSQIASYTF